MSPPWTTGTDCSKAQPLVQLLAVYRDHGSGHRVAGRIGSHWFYRRQRLLILFIVLAEMSAAKQSMLAVNDTIAEGGGPYANRKGYEKYQKNLDAAQQHYPKARIAADTFFYAGSA
jgi:hypothetical protein